MNQFWFGDNQCQIFALIARFLNSSFTRRFPFSSLESVVKWNVVFVYVHYSFCRSVYALTF